VVKKKDLCIQANGKRCFISVPGGRANALHKYLRNNSVVCSPPEPAYTGFDSIELSNVIDVDAVQALLNAWQYP
jgi:hypothetical protein